MNTTTEKIDARTSPMTTQLRKMLWVLVAFFLTFGLFLYVYFGTELHLEVESTVSGKTQFFYPSNADALSQDHSYVSNLPVGRTKLVVPIPLSTQWLRWDPINGPGEFVVKSLYLKLPLIKITIPPEYVTANFQIAELAERADGISISTLKNARDPSVRIQLPWQKISGASTRYTLVLTSLLFAAIFMLWRARKRANTLFVELAALFRNEGEAFNKLPLLILFACSFWFLSLASYAISIDDEYAAFRQDHNVWVAQGRWTVYLLTKFILPQPVIPFLPNLIFCISAAISYLVIVRAHIVEMNWKGILLFPIFMAFPFWYFIAEFYANLLGVSIGLILSSVALLIFSRSISQLTGESVRKKTFLMLVALQGVLLGTAIGAYQSYLLAFFSMGLGLLVLNITRDSDVSFLRIIKQIAYLSLVTCTGFVFYQFVAFAFQAGLDVRTQYIDGFVNPTIFLERPWHVIFSTVVEAVKIYTGSGTVFGVSLRAIAVLMTLGLVTLYSSLPDRKWRAVGIALALGCIITPFLLNLLAGGAGRIPYRSMVGVPYVIWLFATLTLYKGSALLKGLAVIAIIVSTFQLVNAHATYNAATQLALEHDKALAAEIYYRIGKKLPDNDQLTHYKVDFYGAKPFTSVFPRIRDSTIGYSFFEWDRGNPHRIGTFMNLIGYEDIATVPDNKLKEFIKYYNDMPIWPSIGAVRQVGDVFLVKLGKQPGLTHQQ